MGSPTYISGHEPRTPKTASAAGQPRVRVHGPSCVQLVVRDLWLRLRGASSLRQERGLGHERATGLPHRDLQLTMSHVQVCADKDLMLAAVMASEGQALKYGSPELKADREVVLEAAPRESSPDFPRDVSKEYLMGGAGKHVGSTKGGDSACKSMAAQEPVGGSVRMARGT